MWPVALLATRRKGVKSDVLECAWEHVEACLIDLLCGNDKDDTDDVLLSANFCPGRLRSQRVVRILSTCAHTDR